ncbi:toxin glutamine deamidase domain-containing protein [Actinokineospora inagensis]|uniref:toxin glutamine deamidase domain-containing protein n=1 Tax=Actinokineospora inagensis TaxID=103730 RepID=UPI0003F8C3C4|nr:toxin glutamine deamidase domain-containing protein [Actinokineospora inagensis]
MAMMVPDDVRRMFLVITGEEWPDANEDKLHTLATAWDTAANRLTGELAPELLKAVIAIRSTFNGATEQAFVAKMSPFVEGADNYIAASAEQFHGLAKYLHDLAVDVEYVKLVSVLSLVALAVEIAWASAAAAETGGASMAWLAERVAAVRALLRTAAGRLLLRFAQAEMVGMAFQVVIDVVAQGMQFAMGTRHQWNTGYTTNALGVGALGGVLMIPLAGVGEVLAHATAQGVESVLSKFAKFAKGMPGWAHTIPELISEVGVEAFHEVFTETLYNFLTTGEFSMNVFSATSGGVSGIGGAAGRSVRHAGTGAGHAPTLHLGETPHSPEVHSGSEAVVETTVDNAAASPVSSTGQTSLPVPTPHSAEPATTTPVAGSHPLTANGFARTPGATPTATPSPATEHAGNTDAPRPVSPGQPTSTPPATGTSTTTHPAEPATQAGRNPRPSNEVPGTTPRTGTGPTTTPRSDVPTSTGGPTTATHNATTTPTSTVPHTATPTTGQRPEVPAGTSEPTSTAPTTAAPRSDVPTSTGGPTTAAHTLATTATNAVPQTATPAAEQRPAVPAGTSEPTTPAPTTVAPAATTAPRPDIPASTGGSTTATRGATTTTTSTVPQTATPTTGQRPAVSASTSEPTTTAPTTAAPATVEATTTPVTATAGGQTAAEPTPTTGQRASDLANTSTPTTTASQTAGTTAEVTASTGQGAGSPTVLTPAPALPTPGSSTTPTRPTRSGTPTPPATPTSPAASMSESATSTRPAAPIPASTPTESAPPIAPGSRTEPDAPTVTAAAGQTGTGTRRRRVPPPIATTLQAAVAAGFPVDAAGRRQVMEAWGLRHRSEPESWGRLISDGQAAGYAAASAFYSTFRGYPIIAEDVTDSAWDRHAMEDVGHDQAGLATVVERIDRGGDGSIAMMLTHNGSRVWIVVNQGGTVRIYDPVSASHSDIATAPPMPGLGSVRAITLDAGDNPILPERLDLLRRIVPEGTRFVPPQEWAHLISDVASEGDNFDAALAVHSTYQGHPVALGANDLGNPAWAQRDEEIFDDGPDGLVQVINRLRTGGPNSTAILQTTTHGSVIQYNWNLINHNNQILLVDPGNGTVVDATPDAIPELHHVAAITFDRDNNPLPQAPIEIAAVRQATGPELRLRALRLEIPDANARYGDPARWASLVNGGRVETYLGAAAMAFLSSYHGRPVVMGANDRGLISQWWTGARYIGVDEIGWQDVVNRVRADGPGAAAIVIVHRLAEDSWFHRNLVNHNGQVLVYDALDGRPLPGYTLRELGNVFATFTNTTNNPFLGHGPALPSLASIGSADPHTQLADLTQRLGDGPRSWVGLVNGLGDHGTSVDAALAFHSTLRGHPVVLGANALGSPPWVEYGAEAYGDGAAGLRNVINSLLANGDGSAAVMFGQRGSDEPHFWNLVNHQGEVWLFDALVGEARVATANALPGLGRIFATITDAANNHVRLGAIPLTDDNAPRSQLDAHQRLRAMRREFADGTPYAHPTGLMDLVNGIGPEADGLLAAWALHSSYHGNPIVVGANEHTLGVPAWAEHDGEYFGEGPAALQRVIHRVRLGGAGSAAIVRTDSTTTTELSTWNVFFHDGTVWLVDPVAGTGRTATPNAIPDLANVQAVPLDADNNYIHAPEPAVDAHGRPLTDADSQLRQLRAFIPRGVRYTNPETWAHLVNGDPTEPDSPENRHRLALAVLSGYHSVPVVVGAQGNAVRRANWHRLEPARVTGIDAVVGLLHDAGSNSAAIVIGRLGANAEFRTWTLINDDGGMRLLDPYSGASHPYYLDLEDVSAVLVDHQNQYLPIPVEARVLSPVDSDADTLLGRPATPPDIPVDSPISSSGAETAASPSSSIFSLPASEIGQLFAEQEAANPASPAEPAILTPQEDAVDVGRQDLVTLRGALVLEMLRPLVSFGTPADWAHRINETGPDANSLDAARAFHSTLRDNPVILGVNHLGDPAWARRDEQVFPDGPEGLAQVIDLVRAGGPSAAAILQTTTRDSVLQENRNLVNHGNRVLLIDPVHGTVTDATPNAIPNLHHVAAITFDTNNNPLNANPAQPNRTAAVRRPRGPLPPRIDTSGQAPVGAPLNSAQAVARRRRDIEDAGFIYRTVPARWVGLISDGRATGRDAAAAFLLTFRGRSTIAEDVTYSPWDGYEMEHVGRDEAGLAAVVERITRGGDGSIALVLTGDNRQRTWLVVNESDVVRVYDPVTASHSDFATAPPMPDLGAVRAITLDAGDNPITPGPREQPSPAEFQPEPTAEPRQATPEANARYADPDEWPSLINGIDDQGDGSTATRAFHLAYNRHLMGIDANDPAFAGQVLRPAAYLGLDATGRQDLVNRLRADGPGATAIMEVHLRTGVRYYRNLVNHNGQVLVYNARSRILVEGEPTIAEGTHVYGTFANVTDNPVRLRRFGHDVAHLSRPLRRLAWLVGAGPHPLEWVGQVNGLGNSATSLDAARAFHSTLRGNPVILGVNEVGSPEWVGYDAEVYGHGTTGLQNVIDSVAANGYRAAAIVTGHLADGGLYHWNLVNHQGDVWLVYARTGMATLATADAFPEVGLVSATVTDATNNHVRRGQAPPVDDHGRRPLPQARLQLQELREAVQEVASYPLPTMLMDRVNGIGPEVNGLLVAWALHSSYHGNAVVIGANGHDLGTPAWTEHDGEHFGTGPAALQQVIHRVRLGGAGSAAILQTGTTTSAELSTWNLFFHLDFMMLIDPVAGTVRHAAPNAIPDLADVYAVPLDANNQYIHPRPSVDALGLPLTDADRQLARLRSFVPEGVRHTDPHTWAHLVNGDPASQHNGYQLALAFDSTYNGRPVVVGAEGSAVSHRPWHDTPPVRFNEVGNVIDLIRSTGPHATAIVTGRLTEDAAPHTWNLINSNTGLRMFDPSSGVNEFRLNLRDVSATVLDARNLPVQVPRQMRTQSPVHNDADTLIGSPDDTQPTMPSPDDTQPTMPVRPISLGTISPTTAGSQHESVFSLAASEVDGLFAAQDAANNHLHGDPGDGSSDGSSDGSGDSSGGSGAGSSSRDSSSLSDDLDRIDQELAVNRQVADELSGPSRRTVLDRIAALGAHRNRVIETHLRAAAARGGVITLPDGIGNLVPYRGGWVLQSPAPVQAGTVAHFAWVLNGQITAMVVGADLEGLRHLRFPPRGRPLPVDRETSGVDQ